MPHTRRTPLLAPRLRQAGSNQKNGPSNFLPLRRGRIKVAAGSESLWLGEGWTLGSPLTLPSPTRGEGNSDYSVSIN